MAHKSRSLQLVAAILVLGVVVACQQPAASNAPAAAPAAAPATPGAPAVDPLAVVDAYMAAWNRHDANAAAAFFTDDVSYFDASVGVPQVGRDAARDKVIQAFLTAAPDCVWTRDTAAPAVIGSDGVAFQWTFKGTNTGAWGDGTAATGKSFTFSGATIIKIRDGKIAWQGDFYDAYGFYKQLGLAQ